MTLYTIILVFSVIISTSSVKFGGYVAKTRDSLGLELEENFAIYVVFLFTQYAFTLQCIIENFVRFLGTMVRQGG
jgi:hypothetical protein